LLYASLFLVVGRYLPYMPMWLRLRALDENAIAFVLATPLFARACGRGLCSHSAAARCGRRGKRTFSDAALQVQPHSAVGGGKTVPET
jgi:hypothetical protein